MKVALFARVDTALNPYILLFKQALERQGFVIHLEQEFGLRWLVTKRKSCDTIHLHWIEAAYKPSGWHTRFALVNKLVHNRFTRALRGVLRLADFSLALCLAKTQGKTIVYTVHNLEYRGEFGPFVTLNRMAHRVVSSMADRIHTHSHYALKVLETAYNRKDGVFVVPLGNYIGYYPNQISRQEARRQLELREDTFVYLFLGLIRPYKGVEELIDAFGKLALPNSRLLIVGYAPDASYKEKLVKLGQNCPAMELILEFVPDEAIQAYMNACDICVLPYRNITTTSAAVLALSFGRPVIAPAISSFPELVTPETGILYDRTRPNALVSALRQATQRSWSETGILDYVHRFDWDKLGSQLADLYRT